MPRNSQKQAKDGRVVPRRSGRAQPELSHLRGDREVDAPEDVDAAGRECGVGAVAIVFPVSGSNGDGGVGGGVRLLLRWRWMGTPPWRVDESGVRGGIVCRLL